MSLFLTLSLLHSNNYLFSSFSLSLVDLEEESAVSVWEPIMVTNPNIVQVQGEVEFFTSKNIFLLMLLTLLLTFLPIFQFFILTF